MSGSFNFKEFECFTKQLEKLAKEKDKLFQDAAKELAAILLTLVIEKTPVGNHPAESGMVGGTLKRGWTIQTSLGTMQVSSDGNTYTIEVTNPVDYASYVESGHRQTPGRYVPAIGKRLKKRWVAGKFMMRESVEELQKIAPKVLERKIERFLKECLDD